MANLLGDLDYHLDQIVLIRKAQDLINKVEIVYGLPLESYSYSLNSFSTNPSITFNLWGDDNPALANAVKDTLQVKKWEKEVTSSYHIITGVGTYLNEQWGVSIKKQITSACVVNYEKEVAEEIELEGNDEYEVKDGKLVKYKTVLKDVDCPEDYSILHDIFGDKK